MKYSDLEDAFLFVSAAPPFEHDAYLNKETGEAYYVSALGDSELPDDLQKLSGRWFSECIAANAGQFVLQ